MLTIQLIVNALAVGSIYAVTALSFEIAYESTGVVNFSTGQLVTAGALIGAGVTGAMPNLAPLGYLAVIVAMAGIELLFYVGAYLPLRSRPALTVIIGTVAVGILVQNVSLLIWGPLPIATASPVGSGTARWAGVLENLEVAATASCGPTCSSTGRSCLKGQPAC